MKLVDEVEGRKGVLFGVPLRDKGSKIIAKNLLSRPMLRIGARGYGFPFNLSVKDGDERIFEQLVSEKEWADVQVDLSKRKTVPKQVMVELIVPEGQKWSEGVWIDYLDFFEN